MRRSPWFLFMLIIVCLLEVLRWGTAPALAKESGPFFNILDYGAHNDGSAPATDAFRAAIQAAKKAGGGTVYVPAGTYVTGPIEMVSNLTLYFDAGAIVRFPAVMLPFTPGRQQGIETLTPVPLIGGHDLENVAVEGRGTLTSPNEGWMKLHERMKANGSDPGSANGPNWEKMLNDLNAVIENLVIETYPGVHTDGIVVDSSRFVKLLNDYIDTGDDGIVIKSGKDADGLRVNRPTEDVAITNCTVHHAHGAVTIGSETSGSVRNIVANNMTVLDTQNGVRIKSARGRGGVVEDLSFDNWTMENVGEAITVTNYYMMEGETRTSEEPVSKRTPVFRNISISNMVVNGAKVLIDVEGLPEMPISNLHISNIIGIGKTGLIGNYTDGLELHNVQLTPQVGPAFRVENSTNLELDQVSTRKPLAGTPIIRLDGTPGAIVRDSKAMPGTDVFLSTAPGETKNLLIVGNLLGNAKTPQEEKTNPDRNQAPDQRSDR